MQLESSVTLFDDDKVESRFAELQITADGITSEVSRKVGNDEVISRINQSAEAVKIQASKISINGVITAINNDTTTTIDGDKITTGTLSASAVNAQSGTFNTANIPNLSADKITSGTISADRIGAVSIGADKIKVSEINIGAAQITSGTINSARIPNLSADKITTGTLQDSQGNTSFDLSTGKLDVTKGEINLGNGNFIVSSTGRATITSGSTIGGFDIVAASGGKDYIKSDWSAGGIDYRTFIRSATTADKGNTWAFSTQYKKTSDDGYYGAFYVKSNGAMKCIPINTSGDSSGISLEVSTSSIHLETENTLFKMLPAGIQIFFGKTATSQPNIRWSPDNFYLYYTSWTASSEQIKTAIEPVTSSKLDPRNLYDVDIVQFRYKDGIIDKEDQRCGQDLIGFVIENLNEKYPVAVDKEIMDDPKTWSWNNAYLIPPMLKLIQDQKAQIDELKFRMREIEEEINGQGTIN